MISFFSFNLKGFSISKLKGGPPQTINNHIVSFVSYRIEMTERMGKYFVRERPFPTNVGNSSEIIKIYCILIIEHSIQMAFHLEEEVFLFNGRK